MFKKEFTRKVAAALKSENIGKPVSSRRHVFRISDENDNSKEFVFKQTDQTVDYTVDDVNTILDMCLEIAKQALAGGDNIVLKGFGTLGLSYRKPRYTIHPETGEYVDVPGRYVPKFTFGTDLKTCARLFELSLAERIAPLEGYGDPEEDEQEDAEEES